MEKDEFKSKILLITYAVILFVVCVNYKWIFKAIGFIFKVFLPFIIGGILAFILNVLMKMVEKKLPKKLGFKTKRFTSLILSLVIVFGFIAILLFVLIPQIKNAGTIFIENIPEYQENIYEIGEKLGFSDEQLAIFASSDDVLMEEISNLIKKNSKFIINLSFGLVNSVVGFICNLCLGLVFAVYLLLDKEKLMAQGKKLLGRITNSKFYRKTLRVLRLANVTFSNFVKLQVTEAFILGLLCMIGMLILRLPYAATISALVGFSALIPIFGAFVGCIVGAFLIFMVSPLKAVIFVIFFLVLQQIEGNFIYPKVAGNKVGLPSLFVLVAVTVGGTVGGVFGMLLGVPIMSILYSILRSFANNEEIGLKE